MTDCVAIAPELPFKQQVVEFAVHLSRSLPTPSDTVAAREFVASFENQLAEEEEVSDEVKKTIVKSLVQKVGELRGGLEATKESEAESSHLLLQYLLSSTFETSSPEYETLSKNVLEGVKKGGEIAANANRMTRVEAACRILNNTYNYLPPTSTLRPTTLLALLSLLSISSDLSTLSLTPSSLITALSQWTLSSAEKVAFLTSASKIYQAAGDLEKALETYILALQYSTDKEIVETAVVLAIAVESRFDLNDVTRVEGVQGRFEGKTGELVALFTETDELEAVGKGKTWLEANGSWIEGFAVAQFSAESILRKLRLIALATLCARTTSKQLQYSQVASALEIEESDVEAWVIDAIRANLLTARISQPLSLIKIQTVSSLATRRFGSSEWQLLEKRLGEWKKMVADARVVVEEAEGLASAGQGGRRAGRREDEVAA
ncbi:translation initiation factor 3 subunit M, partial [Tremellales sp. Uapishka_1]